MVMVSQLLDTLCGSGYPVIEYLVWFWLVLGSLCGSG